MIQSPFFDRALKLFGILALVCLVPAEAKTIVVGPQLAITTIQEAARMAENGDVIEVMPGDYRQQPVVWVDKRITVRGIGRRPVMRADGTAAEAKAIWVVRNAHMVIENIEFRGARVAGGNGAGIRFESGHLTVDRCAFFDNEMGLLTGNASDAVLEVKDSEFGEAPHHDSGALHHLLYAGSIDKLTVIGSRFQQGFRGHLIKSRARTNYISYNMVLDGATGHASYELEFPNGGLAFVVGNVIGQSIDTENPEVISYGAEGARWQENALYLSHNTLVNRLDSGTFLRVWTEKFPADLEVWAINNLTIGKGALRASQFARSEGNHHVQQDLVSADIFASFQPSRQPALGFSVSSAGQVRSTSLVPVVAFKLPAGTEPFSKKATWLAGGFQ